MSVENFRNRNSKEAAEAHGRLNVEQQVTQTKYSITPVMVLASLQNFAETKGEF